MPFGRGGRRGFRRFIVRRCVDCFWFGNDIGRALLWVGRRSWWLCHRWLVVGGLW